MLSEGKNGKKAINGRENSYGDNKEKFKVSNNE
jgi:hypothetical protein